MGFEPLGTRKLPELRIRYTYVGPVRPRHVRIDPPGPQVGPVPRSKTYPVGTRAAFLALNSVANGGLVTLTCRIMGRLPNGLLRAVSVKE